MSVGRPRRTRSRDQAGAVTVMVAMSMVAVLVAAALVLDFGIARLDRQQNKSVADAAVTAGMLGLDMGDGRTHSFNGVCQALDFLKANKPALSSLSWAACGDAAKRATICAWDDPRTHASFTGSANGVSVEIHSPYDLTRSGWPEEQLGTLAADQLTAQESCNHLAVVVRQTRQPGLGSLATDSDLTTAVRSVGRVAEKTLDDQPVALLLLERMGCNAIVINGTNSFVRVLANGVTPGLIHSDSTGELCDGSQRILVGDHPNGIIARAGTGSPGLIRVRAVGTPRTVHAYDSATNVVAEGGMVGPGPLVGRRPVDVRYMSAAQAATAEYENLAATNGTAAGWVKLGCGASKAELESVTGNLWISCPHGHRTFDTADVTLKAPAVFFDAKSVAAANLAMPNATRVYVSGDTSANAKAVVASGSFSMGPGSSNTRCPDTTTTPTLSRARLVIGGGSLYSSPSDAVKLCGTTVLLRGGVAGGCIPGSYGTAPTTVTCNGQLSLSGTTDWTAPNKVAGQATPADWLDFEDIAFWTEASSSHDVGSSGAMMRLSGVFFLPNGEFKVHGGATQDVRNSQYIARWFRADGGSRLEMQPNPYDVIGVPALTDFTLVR